MNTAFWRVVWKEYRAVRGFWIAVVVLAVLVQVAFVALITPGIDRVAAVYATALGAAALFVVGCMAAAFAAEREEETLQFLQIVPGTWPPVVGGKLAFAGLSTAALIGALFATAAYLVGGGTSLRDSLVDALAVFGVAVIECAAWAALFSLVSRRPLVAAVGAIAAASMATHVAIWFADPGGMKVWSATTYREAWHTRLALAAGVAAVAGLVSRHWLRGTQLGETRRKRSRALSRTRKQAEAASIATLAPPRGRALPIVGRLLWQSWRQWWWVAFLAILLTGPVVGIIAYMFSLMSETPLVPWWTVLCSIVGALLGTLVFLSDQERRQYRFFAERAERPGLVWFSRIVFWGATLLLLATLMHAGLGRSLLKGPLNEIQEVVRQYMQDRSTDSSGQLHWHFGELLRVYDEAWSHAAAVGYSAMVLVCGFCIGQFCSMASRSGVIAGFVASISALVVVAWGAVMIAWALHGHLLWSLLFIPLCLLLATRLRAPAWILERKTVKSWILPTNVVLLPLAVIVLSVPAARLDLPTNDWIRFNADEFDLALRQFESRRQSLAIEGREAADLYFRGCDLVESWQSFLNDTGRGGLLEPEYQAWRQTDEYSEFHEKWLNENADALAFALGAAELEHCYFPPDQLSQRRDSELLALQHVIIESGNQLVRQGNLDAAFDRFLAALRMDHCREGQATWTWHSFSLLLAYDALANWARADGQSPALLRRAIAAVEQEMASPPPVEDAVFADHVRLLAILKGEKDPDAGGVPIDTWRMQLAYLAHQLPWERERALDVLDALSAERHQTVRGFLEALAEKLPLMTLYTGEWEFARDAVEAERRGDLPPHSWLETTYLLRPLYDGLSGVHRVLYQVVIEEQRQRALLLEMALVACRLEHGQYPEKLSDLAGEYLREVPSDLFAARPMGPEVMRDVPFNYHPHGLDGWLQKQRGGLIPPGTPLFWSGGISGTHLLVDDQIKRVPLDVDERGRVVRAQDLSGRPLYRFSEFYSYPDHFETISIYTLPVAQVEGNELRAGRDPREDGVGVVPHRIYDYGPGGYGSRGYGGYGYGLGVRLPYRADGGYGAAAAYGTATEMEGLPPGYDLPPLD